jgi:hypothetical protein
MSGSQDPPRKYKIAAGPIMLGIIIVGLLIQAILLAYGRWRPWIRQADTVHGLVVCAVLTWAIAAGPIFTATITDQAVKGAAALIILITLIDLAIRTRRGHVRRAIEIRQ